MIKIIKKYFLLLVVCSLVGYITLVISYILPIKPIANNVLVTSKNYIKEGKHPNVILDYDASKIGNSTDQIMLLESIYDDGNPFINAINVSRKEISGNERNYTLYNLDKVLNGTEFTQTINYQRYWHGYLIVLKPLLLFFNHDQIKYLNLIIQSILLILIVILMKENKLNKYIIPFIISICFTYPYVISLTMSFSIVYYILLISIIILLKFWEKISINTPVFFYLIGIATCYFDYFTWPLVTLGIPLIFVMILKKNDIKQGIAELFKCCFAWIIGYSLMWLVKFGLGSLITGQNIFADGIQQAMFRSSIFDNNYSYMIDSIKYNFNNMIVNRVNIVIWVITFIILLIQILKNKPRLKIILNSVPLLLISIMPIIWMIIVTNHTFVHYWMVYRILMISLFSLQSFLVSLSSD